MPTDDELHYTIEQAKLHDGPADGPLQYAAQAAQELLDARAELTRLRALTAVPEDLRAVAVRAACDDYNGAMPACEWPACGCTSDGTARYNPTVSIADAILAAVAPRIRADGWQPITDDTPLDQDLLLGWWQAWPDQVWMTEVAWAGASNTKPPGMSNAWRHGQATHWQRLPEPPATIRTGADDGE